ncbi:IS4 family transposase [Candidatus Parcubacteria bacterium]|nr:MAG: IS4 family transposase [Candidatus Parcubacteria bacterium]
MANKKRRNPDHVRRRQMPGPDNEVIEAQLEELVSPAVANQMAYYRQLGLRSRILNLPLMVAAVLTMLWRQVPSVHELTRMLAREDLLWCQAVKVSQQALSQRFLIFPAELFERVLKEILPQLQSRWYERRARPLPESLAYARQHFEQIWVADGSTLEALFRKLKVLEDVPVGQLAGKIGTVVDLMTRLPVEVWFREQPRANDATFIPDLLALVTAKTLLVLDRGFYDFTFFAALIDKQAAFITRLKTNAFFIVTETLSSTDTVKDMIIHLGTGQNGTPVVKVRLIEVRFGKVWYRYITSVLDPTILPPFVVADIYRRRWRIEEAFHTVKRLLNLSYLWTGSLNGIQLQVWATWLFYAILVDLGDAVADRLGLPFDRISLEMLYRGFYHFSRAVSLGLASDPVAYFADPTNQDLGVVKRLRKPVSRLDLSPFPI